ncbi:MAG: hypothetical protein HY22_10370 [[Candidatus Thermochlorobacteriaceae] bacterium GBChlB]|nr:MAG: hypothetical protein HY22_10370 [[Candidatus Thermochlorobacteriaceae] bacterium GBChlB]
MKKTVISIVMLLLLGATLYAQGSLPRKVGRSQGKSGAPFRVMNSTYHNLAGGNFSQNWTNTSLITANDDWNNVPSIIGFLGDYTTGNPTNIDPQTLVSEGASNPDGFIGPNIDVIANLSNPNTATAGGVGEFEITNPTIALQGSGTADAPGIIIYLNATGRQNIQLSFNARDIDGSSDNTNQQIAVHFRVGTSGDFTNLPGGYIADATTGPNEATLVTPVSVTLPASANDQAQVQIRILTTNAPGSDEWVGIDDIVVSSDPLGPSSYSGPPSGVVDATTYSDVTFTSGGAFPAGANITVNGTLQLNDHVVNLNGGSITMGATGTVLPGVGLPSTSDVGRVFGGSFIHNVATVTGAKVFPLGTSTSRRYAAVNYTTAPTNAGTLTGFSTEGNAPSQDFSGVLPVAVSAPFFWTLDAGGGLAGGTYNFALTADNVPGVLNAAQLRIVKRPTGGGPWTIQGTFNTSTFLSGTVAIAYTGLSGFSEFSIASDPVDNPLPVELSSFTGSATAAGVNLRWTTQSELNNAGFAVFRNGEEIASYRFSPTLRGKGTAVGATNYAFLDAGVEVGQRYTYRLRSFDLDGTIHDYPQTVSVEVREPISQRVFNYDLSQNFPIRSTQRPTFATPFAMRVW